jgi:ABC-type antimicrobial peptide transport system permease subunit
VHESLRLQLGWQLDYTLSAPVIVTVFAVAQLVGALSAWLPMRNAADTDTATAVAAE